MQVLYCRDKLGIPMNASTSNGGAIAVGHPYGVIGRASRRPRADRGPAARRQVRRGHHVHRRRPGRGRPVRGMLNRPVELRHAFDADRLWEWLRPLVSDATQAVPIAQFDAGQSNPTYLIDGGTRKLVLRRKPPGTLLPSAHAVEREFRIMRALAATRVPVPRCLALCEDPDVIGSAFYVMEYVEGRIFRDPALPSLEPAERGPIYTEMNRVIAELHSLDPNALGLADYGRAGNYIERQVQRWTKQYRASQTEEIPAMENLIAWLPRHVPPGDETRIVHGDYRLDNVIFDPHEPRIRAVRTRPTGTRCRQKTYC